MFGTRDELPVQRHGKRRFCAEGREGVDDGGRVGHGERLLIDVNVHDESQSTGAACSQRSKADQRAWRRQSSKESGSEITPPRSASASARAESATSGAIMYPCRYSPFTRKVRAPSQTIAGRWSGKVGRHCELSSRMRASPKPGCTANAALRS